MKCCISVLTSLALSVLLGCAENPITTIDRTKDCAQICDRYQECLSTDYNTERCRDRCTDMKDREGTATIDHCAECIRDVSCTGSVFKCAAPCIGIVP